MKIKKTLETARENALLGLENNHWGVLFVNSSSAYYLFAGPSFSMANRYFANYLNENLIFLSPETNTTKEIVFQIFTGYATPATITLSSINENIKGEIRISSSGEIDFYIYK